MSITDRIAIRRIAVERATVISGQSFDAVLAKLAAAVGHPDMSAFARDVVAAGTSADLERIVEAATAPVTVLIDERPDGVHLSYDLMASVLAPYGNAQASAVAARLDEKVVAVLTAGAE